MTTVTSTEFRVHAISPDLLAEVRASGVDVSGIPVERRIAGGGEPLRCCLRDAEPSERVLLFGHAPPIPSGPYREVGPVFAHADACDGPGHGGYPAGWRGRPQVLRAYDSRGWIRDALVHDGTDPDAAIAAFFADPQVAQVHSRNVAYGCFMFAITRPA